MHPRQPLLKVRHTLGSHLLKTGRAAEAGAVYGEDLKRNPNNGGRYMAQALEAQKKSSEAAKAKGAFNAWHIRIST
jgi:predicted Zn-dependent protease